jgi:hypothetical protein
VFPAPILCLFAEKQANIKVGHGESEVRMTFDKDYDPYRWSKYVLIFGSILILMAVIWTMSKLAG